MKTIVLYKKAGESITVPLADLDRFERLGWSTRLPAKGKKVTSEEPTHQEEK